MMFFTSPEMNETSAAPARSGTDGGHRAGTGVAAGAIVFGEQPRVALGGRQRRVAVLEGQRRLGLGQRAVGRGPPSSCRARAAVVPSTASAESPIASAVAAITLVLPEAEPRLRISSISAAVPPSTRLGLNVEVLFAGELAPEAVEDPRELVVGAVAELGSEDLRRVPGLPLHLQLPGRCAAACRHREARIAGAVLESQRRTARLWPLRRARRARAACGSPESSLVAGHDDDDVHVVERRRRS